MDEQAVKRAHNQAAGAAPVGEMPQLPYRTRDRPDDPPAKWRRLHYLLWQSNVDDACLDVATKLKRDPVLASEHFPELWRCDVDGNPLPEGKVDVNGILMGRWKATMSPQPQELALLLLRDRDGPAPGAFVLFTLPPATPSVPATRLAALENKLTALLAAQPPAQPAVPVYDTLEELILAVGGQGEKGALQLNVLELHDGSLSTRFRGRTTELMQFAKFIEAYRLDALSDRAEHRPLVVVTAMNGTGKTTFGLESFAHLPGYLSADAAQLVRNGITVYLDLRGGGSSWKIEDEQLSAEARLVARFVATIFLRRDQAAVWGEHKALLIANAGRLSFRCLIPLIAKAQRLRHGLAADTKICILLFLDNFHHLGNDLSSALRPVLSTMGDAMNSSRCFNSDGVLLVPLLTGTTLEAAKAAEVLSGPSCESIHLEPLSERDFLAILCELLKKPNFKLPAALVDYFAPALDADKPIEVLPLRQLHFRGLVLDCGGNPSLLVDLVCQLSLHCHDRFLPDSNDFLDSLFSSFFNHNSRWNDAHSVLSRTIASLPKSLVPIVVGSLPIDLNQLAVDHKGEVMDQTWSKLLSSCRLTPTPHPSFPGHSRVQMPYFFFRRLVRAADLGPPRFCFEIPFLERSGYVFKNLVFILHAQRTFHLLGKSALAFPGTAFQHIFPGGFVPTTIAECHVQLPNETAERAGGPQFKTEDGWCHYRKGTPGTVDHIPPSALTGDVYKPTDKNHHHFDGRSALIVRLDQKLPNYTTVLLLWQIKLSQPGSRTTFGVADIRQWHERARRLTEPWAKTGVKAVFVLVLFRKLSAATETKNAKTVCDRVRGYVEASGDLIVVTMEHMGDYLAGLWHRVYVALESRRRDGWRL